MTSGNQLEPMTSNMTLAAHVLQTLIFSEVLSYWPLDIFSASLLQDFFYVGRSLLRRLVRRFDDIRQITNLKVVPRSSEFHMERKNMMRYHEICWDMGIFVAGAPSKRVAKYNSW